jgi:hypothetical protein
MVFPDSWLAWVCLGVKAAGTWMFHKWQLCLCNRQRKYVPVEEWKKLWKVFGVTQAPNTAVAWETTAVI